MGIIRKSKTAVKPGDRFERWTVIGVPFGLPVGAMHVTYVVVECICGIVKAVPQQKLREHRSRSCGCLKSETIGDRYRTHGESQTSLYKVWHGMISRCHKRTHESWQNYGGRGITICEEWKAFPAFKIWAVAAGYSAGLSIERVNNDGNYEPGNCKWETKVRQCRNTRRTVYIEAYGERKSLPDWAEDARCMVCSGTLRSRIKLAWDAEQAIATPARQRWIGG